MSLDHSANPGCHPLKDRGADLYETPPVAVEALMRAERLPTYIWEPSCGRGSIVNILRAAGHQVVASDLVDYKLPLTCYWRRDFLLETAAPEGTQAIVTNPPYKLATQFAEHAINLCPHVCLLLRLAFLEGVRRAELLSKLSRVHVFARRLPMMHRDGWEGNKATSAIAFAWFVWDASCHGPTILDRI